MYEMTPSELFAAEHATEITNMLDAADTIVAAHDTLVSLRVAPGMQPEIFTEGEPLWPDTVDRSKREVVGLAQANLMGLVARLHIDLYTRMDPSLVNRLLKGATVSYDMTRPFESQSDERVNLDVFGVQANELSVRGLTVILNDQIVRRSFLISRIERGANVYTRVVQDVTPVEDESFFAMATFFEEHGDSQSIGRMQMLVSNMVMGKEPINRLIAVIRERYQASAEELGRVDDFIRQAIRQAQNIRTASKFMAENPDISLPSPDELKEYGAVVARLQ